MKITGIEIGEYRQFKDIQFDFTYPEGHPKAGQPLEKVCFIGQSGTGKTTLLEMIWGFCLAISQTATGKGLKPNVDILPRHDVLADFFQSIRFSFAVSNRTLNFDKTQILGEVRDRDFLSDWYTNQLNNEEKKILENIQKSCIYLKDSISLDADAFLADQREQPQTFNDLFKTSTQIKEDRSSFQTRIVSAGAKKAILLGDMISLSAWQYLLKDIISYDNETQNFVVNLGQKLLDPETTTREFRTWLATNPRIELGTKCLNPILEYLHLELGLVGEDGALISLRSKKDSKIPNNTLSTGTRQLLATAIPIYKFDTKGTVILFDEPERSLFPDVQRELVKYYTGLAPDAQFFFATHSPIIAAAFEPCERFILYFDENGEVKCHKGVAPIGDDPNDVLRQDFGMSPLMSDEGLAEYQRYLDLATKIKNEPDIHRKMELIAERSALGNKYNFAVTSPDETN